MGDLPIPAQRSWEGKVKARLSHAWVDPGQRPPQRPEPHPTLHVMGLPSGRPCSWPSVALGPKARALSPSSPTPPSGPDGSVQGRYVVLPPVVINPCSVVRGGGWSGWAGSAPAGLIAHGQLPGELLQLGGGSPEVWLVLGGLAHRPRG